LQAEYFPTLGYFCIQYPRHTPIFRKVKFPGNTAYLVDKQWGFKNMKNKMYKKTNKSTPKKTLCDIHKMLICPVQYPAWSGHFILTVKTTPVISH